MLVNLKIKNIRLNFEKQKIRRFLVFLLISILSISYTVSANPPVDKSLFIPAKQESEGIFEFLFNLYDGVGTKIENKRKDIIIKKRPKKGDSDSDSTKKDNRLDIRESENGDKYYIFLDVIDTEQKIKISTYNMLGKKVLDIYDGYYKDFNNPYEVPSTALPNGLFLCVVQGERFRLAEKFIVSR